MWLLIRSFNYTQYSTVLFSMKLKMYIPDVWYHFGIAFSYEKQKLERKREKTVAKQMRVLFFSYKRIWRQKVLSWSSGLWFHQDLGLLSSHLAISGCCSVVSGCLQSDSYSYSRQEERKGKNQRHMVADSKGLLLSYLRGWNAEAWPPMVAVKLEKKEMFFVYPFMSFLALL